MTEAIAWLAAMVNPSPLAQRKPSGAPSGPSRCGTPPGGPGARGARRGRSNG